MARCRHNGMQQTASRRSLDDFAREFFQQERATCPKVVPYTLSEIVSTSNTIEPNKLAGFLRNEDLGSKKQECSSPTRLYVGVTSRFRVGTRIDVLTTLRTLKPTGNCVTFIQNLCNSNPDYYLQMGDRIAMIYGRIIC
jgi:hypothetical protein